MKLDTVGRGIDVDDAVGWAQRSIELTIGWIKGHVSRR